MGELLDKIKQITNSLPKFPMYLESEESSDNYKEYKMGQGECFSWYIHRSGNDVAVHRWFCSAGTVFPDHTHSEREWIIIYSGTMICKKGEETITLNKGDWIVNEPHVLHSATYPCDTKFLTIVIPPSPDFPKGDPNKWKDMSLT